MSRIKASFVLTALMLFIILAQSEIIRVPGPNITRIQEGINIADSGDTVAVWGPPGVPPPYTYYENIDYLGKPLYVVNLSYIEDMGYTPSPELVIIDGGGGNSTVTIDNVTGWAVLRGFTIQNGNAERGGGVVLINCGYSGPPPNNAPQIIDNLITNNQALNNGGGIGCRYGCGEISRNCIRYNTVGPAMFACGGGISIETSDFPCPFLITDNEISGNTCNNLAYFGGGIGLYGAVPKIGAPTQWFSGIYNNRIKSNIPSGIGSFDGRMPIRGNLIETNEGMGVSVYVGDFNEYPDLGTENDPGKNEFRDNTEFDLHYLSPPGLNLNAMGNYWRTLHTSDIRSQIYTLPPPCGSVNFDPIAASDRVARVTYNSVCETGVIITGDLTVDVGVTLTILPGKTFKFDTTDDCGTGDIDNPNLCELIIQGELQAVGTETENIAFTSLPYVHVPGDWYGIVLKPGSIGNFDYCNIRCAYCGIEAEELSNITVDHSIIEMCQVFGINAYRASRVKIFRSDVNSNIYGIRCDQCIQSGQDITEIRGNTLRTNGRYGIIVLNTDYARIWTNHVIGMTPHSTDSTIYGILIAWTGPEVTLSRNKIEQIKKTGSGFYCIGTNSRFSYDTLDNNYDAYGFLFSSGATAFIYYCWLNNNKVGVFCEENSFPDLGLVDEIPNPGLNSFIRENGYYIVNNNLSPVPILAQGNWWDSDPPDPAKFIGPVDYRNWLNGPPPPPPDDSTEEGGGGQSADIFKPIPTFALNQPKPNPTNRSVKINYALPNRCKAEFTICDVLGRTITNITEEKDAGFYEYLWQGKDQRGKEVPNGIYIVRLKAGINLKTQRIVLAR